MSDGSKGWLTEALQSGQHVWTVPPATSFLDSLAQGLLSETGDDPLALAQATILLPTRRSTLALRDAFLRFSDGQPLLLPRVIALQDIDEEEALLSSAGLESATPLDIAPPISPLTRQILLTRQIMGLPGPDGQHPSAEQGVLLAQELARLLDQVQTEGLTFDALSALVPENLAAHWQITLTFLKIVTEHWPAILDERGVIDPADHRNRVFAAQADAWRATPPDGLIIAAGSTGSVPATRDLLATVAGLPRGCVVLPGLDQSLDEDSWDAVEDTHPQFILKTLLSALDVDRADIAPWPSGQKETQSEHRQVLISELMRPASTSDQWRALDHIHPDSVDGIQRIEAPTPREEAAAIALLLRSVVDEEGRTGALVTPDRDLARWVSAELERWDLKVDDSGGQPLSDTPPGVFLHLTAAMVYDACAPVPLLSALKHPLAAGGMDPPAFRERVRDLERAVLRGPRPPEGMDGLRSALADHTDTDASLASWLAELETVVEPFARVMESETCPFAVILEAHLALAEALATTNEKNGALVLWAGTAGEQLARFLIDLKDASTFLEPIDPLQYPGLLDALMKGIVVRPSYGTHPRLSILGPLEARLLQPDKLILSGMNEGTWPAEADTGPWMSRPMRQTFGLPLPERRIGQAAHDIAQALCAREVILTRSLKVDGTPTVPSCWWRRFDQVVEAAGIPFHTETGRYAWLPWAAALTRPKNIQPQPPPAPSPSVDARPRRMSVTEVETWMCDPYEIYARHVLKLRALEPIDADASSADYGIIIHDILQTFIRQYPDTLPDDPLSVLNDLARHAFGRGGLAPGVLAFWAPRFEKIAAWFIEEERARRDVIDKAHAEIKGSLTLEGPAGPFTLIAKADRIDAHKDGTLTIIDYKTGAVPSAREVEAGYAPQLPLEAIIAAAGGFENIKASKVEDLSYWRLTGRGDGGEISPAGDDPDQLRQDALDGVLRLIAAFDDPDTPYEARPHPDMAPSYGDTQHLARVKEWAAADWGEA